MSGLIILIVFGLAAIFGICFLVFKVIWLLARKQRNFWPLVLAGVGTLLAALVLGTAAYQGYTRFLKPFQPILQAADRKQPVYGTRLYTDPSDGFTLTLHDGMTLSDWIQLNDTTFLIGVDTNSLLDQSNQDEEDRFFAGLLLLRRPLPPGATARTLMQQIAQQLKQTSSPRMRLELDGEPALVDMGPNPPAYWLSGVMYSSSTPLGLPAMLLLTVHGQQVYYLVGAGQNADDALQSTLRSLRFPVR